MSEGPVGGRAAANPSPAHTLGQAPAQALRRSLLSSSPQGCGTGPLSTTSLRMKNVNHREITRREGGTLAWLPVLSSLSPQPAGPRPQTPPPSPRQATLLKSHTPAIAHMLPTPSLQGHRLHTERVPRNSTKQYQETAKVRILIFSLGLLNANCGSEHGVTHESVPCLASGANVIPPETWVTGQGSENR